MLLEYSQWQIFEGASEGSGRSDKVWLTNPDSKEIGLFKFTKTEKTMEHVSEKSADEVLSKKRKILIKKFLLEKVKLMNAVFLKKEE